MWTDKFAGNDISKKQLTETCLPSGHSWEILTDTEKIVGFINNQFDGLIYSKEHIDFYKSLGAIFKTVKFEGNIVGLVSLLFADTEVYTYKKKMTEVNFLCIDRKFRSSGYINLFVAEIIRLSVLEGVSSGFYTSTRVHPNLKAIKYFYHFPVNTEKLLKCSYIQYKTPPLKPMKKMNITKVDISSGILDQINTFASKYAFCKKYISLDSKIFQCFTSEGNVIIFYTLDYLFNGVIIKNGFIHSYSFEDRENFSEFVKNCILKTEYDLITCLDIMENLHLIIAELDFKRGSFINYYLFNESINLSKGTNLINF